MPLMAMAYFFGDLMPKSDLEYMRLQRMVAAVRMLAYGMAADALDEYLQMSEDSEILSLKCFCDEVISHFSEEYLREPTEADLTRIIKFSAVRGFPGCVGIIDCQHWKWKNCPMAWVGQFKGKEKKPTIVLEAICDAELWIWHAFFGSPGSLHDVNVMQHSTTIQRIQQGEFPPSFPYKVNGRQRTLPYYLADGIYPDWAIFVKTIKEYGNRQQKAFDKAQEAVRKDVEREFAVLAARFHILSQPCRLWSKEDIAKVMKTCIIIHNIVVEARRGTYESGMESLQFFEEATNLFASGTSFVWESQSVLLELLGGTLPDGMWASMVLNRHSRVNDLFEHCALQNDLIKHTWNRTAGEGL